MVRQYILEWNKTTYLMTGDKKIEVGREGL
jgi:hypothetical protein